MAKYEVIEDWYDNRKVKIVSVIAILLIVVIGGSIYYFCFYNSNKDEEIMPLTEQKEEVKEDVSKENTEEVMIDIKGEINNPGTYKILPNKRVIDVIELAGGLNDKADVTLLNLSRKVKDEMVIIVYSKEEVKNIDTLLKQEELKRQECPTIKEPIKNDACIEPSEQEPSNNSPDGNNKKVSLNTASKEELMTLPGIGEAKALDILEYKKEKGGFKNIEELKDIKGIGESIFDKIKENITI